MTVDVAAPRRRPASARRRARQRRARRAQQACGRRGASALRLTLKPGFIKHLDIRRGLFYWTKAVRQVRAEKGRMSDRRRHLAARRTQRRGAARPVRADRRRRLDGAVRKAAASAAAGRWCFTAFRAAARHTGLAGHHRAAWPRARAARRSGDAAAVSEEGQPIARRGAIKEEPVEVAKLNPLTPAAFIAIEDRRFRRHWGIDPRAIGRAMVANVSRRRGPPGRQHHHPATRQDQLPVAPTARSSARRRK